MSELHSPTANCFGTKRRSLDLLSSQSEYGKRLYYLEVFLFPVDINVENHAVNMFVHCKIVMFAM